MQTWHAACNRVRPYVLKVESPAGSGTGFFFAYNEDRSLVGIATALHVVEEAHEWRQPIKIRQVPTGKDIFVPYGDRAVLVDYTRDSAAILLATLAMQKAGMELPKEMLPLLPATKFQKVGVSLMWGGFPAIAPETLCFFQGTVSAFNKDNDSYFIDGIAINGVSGGPMFAQETNEEDDRPEIAGIVSAYHFNRQRGEALPGLLMVHDATHLNTAVEELKTLDDARKKAEQVKDAKPPEPKDKPGPSEPSPTPRG